MARRNGKRLVSVGWLTPIEEMKLDKAKTKFKKEKAYGVDISDKLLVLSLVAMYLGDKINED